MLSKVERPENWDVVQGMATHRQDYVILSCFIINLFLHIIDVLRYMTTDREERAKAANAPHNMHNVVNFLLKVKKFVNTDQELFYSMLG